MTSGRNSRTCIRLRSNGADVVLFVYREEYYHQMQASGSNREKFAEWLPKLTRYSKAEVIIGNGVAHRNRGNGSTPQSPLLLPHAKTTCPSAPQVTCIDSRRRAAVDTSCRNRVTTDLHPERAGGAATEMSLAAQAGGILDQPASHQPMEGLRRCAVRMRGRDKADGYGCGLEPVARTPPARGCILRRRSWRGPPRATLRRARGLRAQRPAAGTAPAYAINVRPVIRSLVELAEWDAFCTANQWRGGVRCTSSGMNRLGISPMRLAALAPGFAQKITALPC